MKFRIKKNSVVSAIAAFIAAMEGLSLTPYKDVGGTTTYCYGETNQEYEVLPLTKEKCDNILDYEVRNYYTLLQASVSVPLNIHQATALVDFMYNVGPKAFDHSTLLRELNKGCYECVPHELSKWIYVNHKPVAGLINRRNREIREWNSTK